MQENPSGYPPGWLFTEVAGPEGASGYRLGGLHRVENWLVMKELLGEQALPFKNKALTPGMKEMAEDLLR